MKYLVNCTCGQQTAVTAAAAGTRVNCRCGQAIVVPSFSILRESPAPFSPGDEKVKPGTEPLPAWQAAALGIFVYKFGCLLVIAAIAAIALLIKKFE